MRILHTVAYYPPDEGGGASEVVRQLSERLARRGHEVTVATQYTPERVITELNGVKVKQFRIGGVLKQSVLGIWGNTDEFKKTLLEGGYDIIMNYAAQTWHTDLTCRFLREIRARAVLCACGYSGLIGWRRLVYAYYFWRLPGYLRLYDAVVYHAHGYRDEQFGIRHGITNGRVIPNGIDTAEFSRPPIDFRSYYGVQTPHILLTVGDHYANKGHRRIFEAFARLNRDDVTLVMIGRRKGGWPRGCWSSCRSLAKDFGKRVLMVDRAPRGHVVAAYLEASLFLSGSMIEAFPLVILEAMGSGVPFVAYPAGNIADLPGGLIVRSVAEMVKAVGYLLNSRAARNELGMAGCREQRLHYEWDSIVDQYESLYQELLNSPCRRGKGKFMK
jgi:glycosyltransferase involved in cell wall biosynthesis